MRGRLCFSVKNWLMSLLTGRVNNVVVGGNIVLITKQVGGGFASAFGLSTLKLFFHMRV